jgi:acid phosphatase class B
MSKVGRAAVAQAPASGVKRGRELQRAQQPVQVEAQGRVDRVDAPKAAAVDGRAFVVAALKDIAARAARGEKVRVAFDIDDTLADTRMRTLKIAQAWDKANGTHYFDRLTLAQVGHSGADTAKALNLPWPADKAFAEHWEQAFWDGCNFMLDEPIAEIVQLVKDVLKAKGEVVFLTGRTADLKQATLDELNDKLGLQATVDNVICKPDVATRTIPFKTEWIKANPVAFFFTESRRDIAGIQAGGAPSPSVLFDTPFSGTEGIRPDTPVYGRA